jgi:hypothetical protein
MMELSCMRDTTRFVDIVDDTDCEALTSDGVNSGAISLVK